MFASSNEEVSLLRCIMHNTNSHNSTNALCAYWTVAIPVLTYLCSVQRQVQCITVTIGSLFMH